jgi:hypothetical protein
MPNVLGTSAKRHIWLVETRENINIHATMMAASEGKGVGSEGLAVDGS